MKDKGPKSMNLMLFICSELTYNSSINKYMHVFHLNLNYVSKMFAVLQTYVV